jgi:hypothetical protein
MVWWERKLVELRPRIERRLVLNGASVDAADLVGEASLQVIEKLSSNPERYSSAWFRNAVPAAREERGFEDFVWTVARARWTDHLRLALRTRLDVPAPSGADATSEARIDARVFLHELADVIERLELPDSALLTGEIEGGRAMTGRERVRLHRLRKTVAQEVLRRLTTNRKKT